MCGEVVGYLDPPFAVSVCYFESYGVSVRRTPTRFSAATRNAVPLAVEGGGHTWPGAPGFFPEQARVVSRDISASDELIAFFQGLSD